MNFLKKFFSSESKFKSYEKSGEVLKNPVTTKEQREEAIDALEKVSPEFAIPQLLKRFEIVVDSGIIDTREKERCMKIIVSHREHAKELIKINLSSKKRISWQMKIAEKIFDENEYKDILIKNLNTDMQVFDEDVLERNTEILLALKELSDEKIVDIAQKFLQSRDEHVRMAALECLEEQASHIQQAKQIILDLLLQTPNDDNSRFLGVATEVAKKHGWI